MRYHGSFHTRASFPVVERKNKTKQQHSLEVRFSRVIEGGVSGDVGYYHCVCPL